MNDYDEVTQSIFTIQDSILKGIKARDYQDLETLIMERYELVLKLSQCSIPAELLMQYLNDIKAFDGIFAEQVHAEREQIKKLMQGINKVKCYLNV